MAITINTAPSLINAAWHPIIYEVTSDRYASTAVAVTGVSSGTGAKARYAVASHSYLVGDVITGSGFTGAGTAYNVRQTVTVINAAWFETDLDFATGGTGAGTITRTNDNFQIKCETAVFDSAKKTISNSGNNGGYQSVTTSTAHGYVVGDIVYVEGTTSGSFDGVHQVRSITSTTVFVLETAYSGVASLVGSVRVGSIKGTKAQTAITVSGVTLFRVNPNGHLQSVLSSDIIDNAPTNIQTPQTNSIKLFAIRFTERFDGADGLQKSGDYKLSTRSTGIRAVLQRSEGIVIATNYDLNTPGNKFLTDMPNNSRIRPGEELQLSFIYSGSTQLRTEIIKYNLAGVALSPAYTSLVSIVDYKGIVQLNSNHFDNTVSKFDIMVVDNVPNGISESRTFIVDRNNYQNPIRIYFENYKGGFDGYTFTGRYTESNAVNRTLYKKSLPLAYSIKDRGNRNIAVRSERTYEVFSQFITKEEATWLQQLFDSPNVFIKQIGDTSFTPIIVLTDESGIYDSDGLTQVKLVFQYATNTLTLGN